MTLLRIQGLEELHAAGSISFGPKIDLAGSPLKPFTGWVGGQGEEKTGLPQGGFPQIPQIDPAIGKYTRFLPVAHAFASMSRMPGTKVGCLILGEGYQVLSSGWNGAPRGSRADVDERLADRDTRLTWVVHAEANAIANASRSGTPLNGSTLICTLMPCMSCAKLIVQAGVIRVLCPHPGNEHERWAAEFELSRSLFKECGVELVHPGEESQ